jgi:hypothetical protein
MSSCRGSDRSALLLRIALRAIASTTRSLPRTDFPSLAHPVMTMAQARRTSLSLDQAELKGSHRSFRDDAVAEEGALNRPVAAGERGPQSEARRDRSLADFVRSKSGATRLRKVLLAGAPGTQEPKSA